MAEKQKLNLDLSNRISQLKYLLKHFEIRTKKFKRFFRGKSFEFEGYGEYSGEEDISRVDWKASLRGNKLLIRKYTEEEDMKILFVIDTGEQMVSGSTERLKCEYAAEIALSLIYLIIKGEGKAGCLVFNDKVRHFIPPKKGINQFNLLLDLLSDPNNYGGKSNIGSALDFISDNLDDTYSAIVFLSDFAYLNEKLKSSLNEVGKRFETVAFMVNDPVDKALPNISGEFIITDPRTQEQLLIEPALAKNIYKRNVKIKYDKIRELIKDADIDCLELLTSVDFVPDVTSFLETRVKRRI